MTSKLAAIAVLIGLTSCAGAPANDGARAAAPVPLSAGPSLPVHVTIEGAGYATLLSAPSSPSAPLAAQSRKIPEDDDRSRNPDRAAVQAAQALDRRLRVAEAGNYVGIRVVRDPRPRIAFQFRQNASAALARHSRDPRFTTREGGVPAAELQPIFDEWFPLFVEQRLLGGGSVQEFDGEVVFDMTIDEAGFRAIAAKERWTLPGQLRLNFGPPPNPRSIDPALASLVRVFPRSDRLPGAVNQAALRGRIILRDGCFRLADHRESEEPLVLFDRDAELIRAPDNFMVLRDGTTTRIGETVVWAGPRAANEADAGVKALRDRCGGGQIIPVGAPISAANFPPRNPAPGP